MTPLVDVTATLGTGAQVFDISGRWALRVVGGRVIGAVDMNDGVTEASFTFETEIASGKVQGFSAQPYRNNIPIVLWDENSQRFCGYVGQAQSNNNPLANAGAYQICDKAGNALFIPKFSQMNYGDGSPPTQGIAYISANNGSFIGLVTDWGNSAVLFGGILDNGQISRQPVANCRYANDDPLPNPISYSYGIVVASTVFGNQQALLCYNEGQGETLEAVMRITEIEFPFNSEIRGQHAIPAFGPPTTTNEEMDGQVLSNLSTYNLNFQYVFVNSLSICAWDGPGGTSIDKTTGLPDHTLSSFPVPYDINIAGQYYTPLFPTEFNFNGTMYSFGGTDGVIRGMTIMNGNIIALAEYPNGIGGSPGLLMMVGGIYDLTILKSDTLNWKMSLTYGMQGPGTSNPAGLYPSEGQITLQGEYTINASPGEIDEEFVP